MNTNQASTEIVIQELCHAKLFQETNKIILSSSSTLKIKATARRWQKEKVPLVLGGCMCDEFSREDDQANT